ncbi:MAG TPA: hypothetical protein PKD17_07630 [Cellvibrionaceae bacterium]|nr:hypothetical protein [Cellvibrionaceae bacterium]
MNAIPLPAEFLDQFTQAFNSTGLSTPLTDEQTQHLKRVLIGSHYARQQFQRNPNWLEQLLANPMSEAPPLLLEGDEITAGPPPTNAGHNLAGFKSPGKPPGHLRSA